MKEFNEEKARILTAIARPIVKDDPAVMFASEEDLLMYEHFFINGMEKMMELSDIDKLADTAKEMSIKDLPSFLIGCGLRSGIMFIELRKAHERIKHLERQLELMQGL